MSHKKYIISTIFFLTVTLHPSQEQTVAYSSGQKNLYPEEHLAVGIRERLQEIETAFTEKPIPNYLLAKTLAAGTQRYIDIMELPKLDSITSINLNFIIAKSHIELESPQHALDAFRKIHDQKTAYGTITSEDIANSLDGKIRTLSQKDPFFQKLPTHSHYFKQCALQCAKQELLKQYKQEYQILNLDQLISKVRITKDPQRLAVLMSFIKEHAQLNNMKALCLMATAYNTGQYGVSICQKTAFEYAHQYVTILAQNPATIPHFGRFGIEHTFANTATKDNPSRYKTHLYYKYLQATRNNDTNATRDIITELKSCKDISSPLRAVTMDICAAAQNIMPTKKEFIEQIQQLDKNNDFDAMIKAFILSDGSIIIPLLQSLTLIKTDQHKSINYLLGLVHFHKNNADYVTAKHYFELS